MRSHAVQRYVEGAVRFVPRRTGRGSGRPLRVASTLLTCTVAAEVLNEMKVPPESDSTYRYVNVHNPRCPLTFNAESSGWVAVPPFEDHPVWGINWTGALLMCEHLGGRLPLAEEWECIASNNDLARAYPWGNEPPSYLRANYDEYFGGTSPVGSFPPTELGLFDLAGNLSEWCHDHYDAAGRRGSPERVVKGGAWSKDARYLEIASARGKWERLGTTTIGLRPVWED